MEVLLSKKYPSSYSYDVLGEMNAGNFLVRRSLEDMPATEGQYRYHRVMLQGATDGAIPSDGPLNKMFRPGNRERYHRAGKPRLEGKLHLQINDDRKWTVVAEWAQTAV